jgi:hypothetical protein
MCPVTCITFSLLGNVFILLYTVVEHTPQHSIESDFVDALLKTILKVRIESIAYAYPLVTAS